MDAGQVIALGHLFDAARHQVIVMRRIGIGMQQQARAGGGCKRYPTEQLGIIIATGTFEGMGPAMVEDIFAIGMVLDIERCHAEHLIG